MAIGMTMKEEPRPPTPPPPGDSILQEGGSSGVAMRGLLVSLLTIFDTNGSKHLSKDEFVDAAGPLGYDATDKAWAALRARFGDRIVREDDPEGEHSQLDLDLVGEHFKHKYDSVLEELLRRLLKGEERGERERGHARRRRRRRLLLPPSPQIMPSQPPPRALPQA